MVIDVIELTIFYNNYNMVDAPFLTFSARAFCLRLKLRVTTSDRR